MSGSIQYFILHVLEGGRVDEEELAALQGLLERGYGFSHTPVPIMVSGTTEKIGFFLERGPGKQTVLTQLVTVASGGSQDVDDLMAVQHELIKGYKSVAAFPIVVAGTTTQVLHIVCG